MEEPPIYSLIDKAITLGTWVVILLPIAISILYRVGRFSRGSLQIQLKEHTFSNNKTITGEVKLKTQKPIKAEKLTVILTARSS